MCSKKSPFTLLEIVIAIAILLFVVIVGYGLMTSGLAMREQNKRVVRKLQIEHNILALIAKDIQRCQWLNDKNTNILKISEDPQVADSSTLNLVTFFESQDPETDQRYWLNEVGYKLDFNIDSNDYTLFRRTDHGFDKDISKGGKWTVVYESLASFKIQCLSKGEWIDSWDSQKSKSLPEAIDIKITLGQKDGSVEEPVILNRKVLLTKDLSFKRHKDNVDVQRSQNPLDN